MNYSVKGDLSSKEIGGELYIYNRIDSTISTFNGTGAFIWKSLNNGLAFDEISRRLEQRLEQKPLFTLRWNLV